MRTRGRKQVEDNFAAAVAAASSNNYSYRDGGSNSRIATKTASSPLSSSASSSASTPPRPRSAKNAPPVKSSPNSVVRIRKVDSSSSSSSSTPSKSSRRRQQQQQQQQQSKVPALLRFPLIVILNMALSAIGSALAYPYTKAVVAAHERPLETWNEAAVVLGWRVVELALGWFGNYDSYDLTAMNVLSHGPPLYLLHAFYEVPAPALLLSLLIETLSTYVPFRLLRPLSPAHADPGRAPNAEIVTDRPIALLTTLLAGAIYSVTLFTAYATYLPAYMAVYFRGLPSLAAAHPAHPDATAATATTWVNGMLPSSLALGFAARAFVFTPSEAADVDARRKREVDAFDPATATLAETVRWNGWWGWSDQTRAVVRRTALLSVVTGANAFIHARLAVRGVETEGAAAWAAVWVVAAALTGSALGFVGGV